MDRRWVEDFFVELSQEWKQPTRIFLLGGAAALVMGGARPTLDIDFEVELPADTTWEKFEAAVRKVSEKTGVGAQCADSIERWSQLTLLDYRQHADKFKEFGTLQVLVLGPEHWSIGKIGRYLDQDIQDMLAVFKKRKTDPIRLAKTWAQSISQSPKSTQLALVRRQALHFFKTFGHQIWGQSFPEEKILGLFGG